MKAPTKRFEPESTDLARLARHLHDVLGPSVAGAVVGRTLLRDEVTHYLECSQLDAERIVDTMIGRGFIVQQVAPDGLAHWVICTS